MKSTAKPRAPFSPSFGGGWGEVFLLLFSLSTFAAPSPPPSEGAGGRRGRWGASLSIEAEKELSRFFSLTGEEEVRLTDNNTGFDRSVTSLGMDYAFLNRKAKIGVYYAFLYLYNNDYLYEARHRYYLNLSYKETFEPFIFSWRGRLQGTYRDENRGEYKINPKYVMKNKLEAAYMIWGSPWKPYLSCDFSTSLNDPRSGAINRTLTLTRLRFQGGVSWRLDRTTYLDFFLRCDEHLAGDEPRVLSLGATYKMKF